MSQLLSTDYLTLLNDIKERVRSSQYEALKAVNKALIALYWDIGHLIVERQTSTQWGKSVVEQLAQDLQTEFPGTGGFSASNLWRMRQFYQTYSGNEKLAPLVREIGWSHTFCQVVIQDYRSGRIELGVFGDRWPGCCRVRRTALDQRPRA